MQQGFTVWFTGLSGSGKTTLSRALHEEMLRLAMPVEWFDGDIIRTNLSKGLGYSREHRDINVRRIGFVAGLLNRHGVNCVVSLIAPFRQARLENRQALERYAEVYCQCPLDALVARDPKGLYRRAMAGELQGFTGVSDPYEEPVAPEVVVHTSQQSVAESFEVILTRLRKLGYLGGDDAADAGGGHV